MTMFRKLNFWPLPKAPGGGDPKNCAGAWVIHVSNSHTKSVWISEKNLFDPQSPMVTPKSHPWAWPRWPNENLVWYIIYLSFVRRYIKFGLKMFEIDFVISDLMLFDLLAPYQGPRGRDPKNWAGACSSPVSNSHTESGWISEKKFTPTPHGTPKSHPWRMTQAAQWKSGLICLISFICEKKHKVWFKNLWNWLCNWNLMIFIDFWSFGLSPGPQGAGPQKNVLLRAPFMWATHTPNLVGFLPMV